MSDHADFTLIDDPRITALGLLFETYSGIRGVIDADLEAHGVPGSAFEVLLRLARSPDQRLHMSELALQSTLSNSGLTRVVDRLDDAGYVVRERQEHDRRVVHAIITDAGIALVARALPSHLEAVEASLTGVLDADELAGFLSALRKIRGVVKPGADPARAIVTPP